MVDDHWLIEDGLKAGDRVVVEGFQKFVAGERVRPVPWQQERTASSEPDTHDMRRVETSTTTVTR